MPFDPSGNFTRVHNWQEDRDNGIRILADRHDEEDDNFADAFNQVFLRTGTVPMTGNLVMNGYKITSIAAGSETVPSLTWELSNNTGWWQPSPNALAASTQGVKRIEINNDGITVPGSIKTPQAVIGGTLIYNTPDSHVIELGVERTTDGASFIDFHATPLAGAADYEARIIRGGGANGSLSISNKGAASLILNSETAGGNVIIQTLGANRFAVWDNGDVQFYNNVAVAQGLSVAGNVVIAGRETVQVIDTDAVEFPRLAGGVAQAMAYADQGSLILSANRHLAGQEKYWTFQGATGNIYGSSGQVFWNSSNDGAGSGLDADLLDGYQAAHFQLWLGYNPVQQGTGIGQNAFNTVKIGWTPGGTLNATVDSTDQGAFAMVSRDNNFGASQTFWGPTTGIACQTSLWCGGNIDLVGAFTGQGSVATGGPGAMLMFQARDNTALTYGWYATGNFAHLWRNDDGDQYEFHPTAFRSPIDQKADCGGPSQRWFTVWCRTSAMSTSDLREKDWRGGLNDTELEVAKALAKEIGIYRWLSDMEKDGDSAKLSCGFAAQHVIALFEKHGLNALDYAFIRYDEWEERTSNGPLIGPAPEPKCIDEEKGIYDYTDDREMEVVCHPAGNRYSIMLADLLAFMMVGQEQRLRALEEKL